MHSINERNIFNCVLHFILSIRQLSLVGMATEKKNIFKQKYNIDMDSKKNKHCNKAEKLSINSIQKSIRIPAYKHGKPQADHIPVKTDSRFMLIPHISMNH